LGVALGADPLTFQGLAGVGDLVATCFSPLSRNHRLGEMLAAGMTPLQALAEIGEAVEGVATAEAVGAIAAQAGVEMPIASTVAAALAGHLTVLEAAQRLLERPPASEASSLD
ncbi:MAG: NAD(P)H-dependent glycerol-3-phosphate dehydrogenase, partial [Dehalococcoidia bacterium]